MGHRHLIYAILLRAQPRDGTHTPFSPFCQRIFKANQPYQNLVDDALKTLGDPFIEGEVIHFCHFTQELLDARQEVVDSQAAIRHAQQVKLLTTNAFNAIWGDINTSISQLEQFNAHCLLHTNLMHQTVRHISNNDPITNVRELLYFQLQAGGCPSSPELPKCPLTDLASHFDCTPFQWQVNEPFIQDGGDNDGYY